MNTKKLLHAAASADWQQVVGNGGPPCFHLDGDRFCLRAERWDGHYADEENKAIHKFVSFDHLLAKIIQGAK